MPGQYAARNSHTTVSANAFTKVKNVVANLFVAPSFAPAFA
ncbi:hypothetical protein BH11PAT4_BH11PAT4_7210 [soil metagenome]